MPRLWKDATTEASIKEKDTTACGNYRGTFLVVHAGKVILRLVARRMRHYPEPRGHFSEGGKRFLSSLLGLRHDV